MDKPTEISQVLEVPAEKQNTNSDRGVCVMHCRIVVKVRLRCRYLRRNTNIAATCQFGISTDISRCTDKREPQRTDSNNGSYMICSSYRAWFSKYPVYLPGNSVLLHAITCSYMLLHACPLGCLCNLRRVDQTHTLNYTYTPLRVLHFLHCIDQTHNLTSI
jgi:hypothetical protein